MNIKRLILEFAIFLTIQVNAQNYLINFDGTDVSSAISAVKVENLTAGTSLTINRNEILRLIGLVGFSSLKDAPAYPLRVYPNPMTKESTVLQVYPPAAGSASIMVYDLTGSIVTQSQGFLGNYPHEYRISGLRNGIYIINLSGKTYHYSTKLLCTGDASGTASLEKISDDYIDQEIFSDTQNNRNKTYVDMIYSTGDILKFTAFSGKNISIKTDIPTEDKTISFKFIECIDKDNNIYPVVEIGSQFWMAENLKTTRFNDGSLISYPGNDITNWNSNISGAYAWYDNNPGKYKNKYGALYNWYAVNSINLCPSGWHVPTSDEWKILSDNLGGAGVAGGKIKEAENAETKLHNNLLINQSGLSISTAGMRTTQNFSDIKLYGYLWSSSFTSDWSGTPSWYISSISDIFSERYARSPGEALSVRCIYGQSVAALARIITSEITGISPTNATGGGSVSGDGGSAITAKGICWSTSNNPSTTDNYTSDGANSGNFVSDLSGLLPGTTYHVRAYAANGAGTSYGDEITFTTPISLPVLSTLPVSNITRTNATSGGNITSNGGLKIISSGVCWSISANPSVSGPHTLNSSEKGSFSGTITGLISNTRYYLRAYATNDIGTGYGNEITFTTSQVEPASIITSNVTSVTSNGAFSGGTVTDDGGGPVIMRGICWATTPSPAITDEKTENGPGSGNYTSTISGLDPATTYHVKAFAINSAGIAYGNDLVFTTSAVIPSLTTDEITGLKQTRAISGGNIISNGGAAITESGVCWSTAHIPTATGAHSVDGTSAGSFISYLTGLSPNTLYYIRSYATNSVGTGYGNEISFTTDIVKIPTISTIGVSLITPSTAQTGGNVTEDGGASVTARGVCWSVSANPTINNAKTSDGSGTGSFISSLSGLNLGTLYHVRAYATNSKGTAYGDDLTFTTRTSAPALTTATATAIARNSATSGGTIISNGGTTVTVSGICWSTEQNPTVASAHSSDGTTTGSFSSAITGLTPNTIYYVKAYATNNVGTGYGNEISFTTNPITVPTLTTTAASSISTTSAVSGGNISNNGGAAVTSRGICWSLNSGPTISDAITDDGSGTGSFTSTLTGLDPGTTYHARAYAVNNIGTAYGNELTFTTAAVLPVLTTTIISGISQTTATSGGNISYNGGATITASGICWRTTSNPTISGTHTADGSATGSFSSSMTGLTPNTLYYVRAYATNSAGTAYGNEVSFTTDPVHVPILTTNSLASITSATASSGGNITDNGGGAITSRGVCWSLSSSPTTSNDKTADGTGSGSFTSNLSGLQLLTTYHVRAYAINSAGTGYGNELVFTTIAALPSLTTTVVSGITRTTANTGGNITFDGGANVTERGICWSTSQNPSVSGSHTSDGTSTGNYISNLSGLVPGTLYYVRAYATNSSGTGYGNEISFTTNPILIPTITTTIPSSVGSANAVSGGNITDDGGGTITARGVCWSTSASPTTSNSTTSDGTGTGSFSSNITGLLPGTTYHVRAYARNSKGTAYGDDLTFTTIIIPPTITTTSASAISYTTATSGGNITSNGGAVVTTSGICWSTGHNPSVSDFSTTNGSALGSFSSNIAGLLPGTLYYVRAYAENSAGTTYGNEISFTTIQLRVATLTTNTVSSITYSSAVAGGNITDDGGTEVTERGVCWSTSQNPTISSSKTIDGTGPGSFSSSINGLMSETTYYLKAYATNSTGTSYGAQRSFTTPIQTNPNISFNSSPNGLLLHSVGNKSIIYKLAGADWYVQYSGDNGASYNAGVKVTGFFREDNKARILNNGNIILFCGSKIYYSDNNLATITPCTVLNKDGSPYILHTPVNAAYPGSYFNFMAGFAENNGVYVMGNYSNSWVGASPVNLYYTMDGITWKVFYTFGQNPNYTDNGSSAGGSGGTLLGDPGNPLIARHIHAVNVGEDGNFYACSGDGNQEIHVLRCNYSPGTDTWSVTDLLNSESRNWQRMRTLGLFEKNGYLYWGSDGPGTFTSGGVTYNCYGIYKCAIADINDASKHVLLRSLNDACYSFLNVGNMVFSGLQSLGYIYISFDYGETWTIFIKPAWMTGTVEGIWYNDQYRYFCTDKGVIIESILF
jgi:uncharacterized protein (TIGR02145 family)